MSNTTFENWCIVELFGHNQIAGLVTEESLGGASFIRVDVPAVNGSAPFTKLYGAAAIYAITPTTEEIALVAAETLQIKPVSRWVIESVQQKQLPQPAQYSDQEEIDRINDMNDDIDYYKDDLMPDQLDEENDEEITF